MLLPPTVVDGLSPIDCGWRGRRFGVLEALRTPVVLVPAVARGGWMVAKNAKPGKA